MGKLRSRVRDPYLKLGRHRPRSGWCHPWEVNVLADLVRLHRLWTWSMSSSVMPSVYWTFSVYWLTLTLVGGYCWGVFSRLVLMMICSLGCYILLIELIYISLYMLFALVFISCGGILREVLRYYTKGPTPKAFGERIFVHVHSLIFLDLLSTISYIF
jgi:hypothetical protein